MGGESTPLLPLNHRAKTTTISWKWALLFCAALFATPSPPRLGDIFETASNVVDELRWKLTFLPKDPYERAVALLTRWPIVGWSFLWVMWSDLDKADRR